MIRSHMLSVVTGITVGIVVGLSSRPAFAIKQFSDQFKAMYVKPESTDPNEKALAAEFETAKCNVCHVGKNKKERNTYGEALADLLDKKEDKEDTAKIKKSLETVAAMPSEKENDKAKTFGDLIKEGKLPGGPPK